MGFEDLVKFNVALLDKQGWHLLENPGSLSAQLIRTRYFPNSTFLESSLGKNPSLTWRSIWSAKGLLQSGLKWRIGSGLTVSIWVDFWLSARELTKISTVMVQNVNRVCDLIDHDSNCWKTELIRSFFCDDEANAIMSIPLPNNLQPDKLIWNGEHTNVYSLRSGYRSLL